MDSGKVVKFLNGIGLNRNVSDEDQEAFQDYLTEPAGSINELSEDEEPVATQDESLISVASVIREFPRPEELPDIEIFDENIRTFCKDECKDNREGRWKHRRGPRHG